MLRKFPVHKVQTGTVMLGGTLPVTVQTMTNTSTLSVDETLAQCIRIAEAGAHLVRISVKNKAELSALEEIRQRLYKQGITIPVIADIHFSSRLAVEAAGIADKVRINPGNYYKPDVRLSDAGYLKEIRKNLTPLIKKCTQNNVAIRIGTNHGSLSDRIKNRFGTGAEAMAEASMEFVRLIAEAGCKNLVLSVKASNVPENIKATQLLASMQQHEGYSFPIHLGVTEAGLGFSGRIKSAAGIASLLADGIGDTIRVSLTEAPEHEIPVALQLSQLFCPEKKHFTELDRFHQLSARHKAQCKDFVILGTRRHSWLPGLEPDVFMENEDPERDGDLKGAYFSVVQKTRYIVIETEGKNSLYDFRQKFNVIASEFFDLPVIWKRKAVGDSDFQYRFAAELGNLLSSGILAGLWIDGDKPALDTAMKIVYEVLQFFGKRNTHADFISCPSCNRTCFDIMQLAEEVRSRTFHLKGLSIAVMGCIVNGPGEMGAADYGLVGHGKGLLALYHKGVIIETKISENEACNKLLELIEKTQK